MQIVHIALWTEHLDELRDFYCLYFGGRSKEKYTNPAKGFESYVISFEGHCKLELMRRYDIQGRAQTTQTGLTHFAFACKSRQEVNQQTERLRADGYMILGEPRTTGDGCFESVIGDPDGNAVEIVFE